MSALVIIGAALYFAVGKGGRARNGHVVHAHAPAAWVFVVVIVLGIVSATLVQMFGYRLPAISPNADPAQARRTGLEAYQKSMFLRFALSEAVAIISIALTFSSHSNNILPYVLGAVISFVLMAYHVWPTEGLISRVQRKLDRNGGRSDLANALNDTD